MAIPLNRQRTVAVLKWTGIVIGTLLIVMLVTLTLIDWNALRGPIARFASSRLDRTVKIEGPLTVHLWSLTPGVSISGLIVANPPWEPGPQILKVERAVVEIELLPLFVGHKILRRVEIRQPKVYLHQDASGRANWQFGKPGVQASKKSEPTQLPVIKSFVIESGELEITDELHKLKFIGTLAAHEEQSQANSRAFTLQGQGELNRKPFKLMIAGDPLINAEPDRSYAFDAAVEAADIRVGVQGQIPKPFDLDVIKGNISASGQDLADLYYLSGLALPNTPPYKLSTHLERNGNRISMQHLAGSVGASDVSGTITIELLDGRPKLTANLLSKLLRIGDMAAPLGATPKTANKTSNETLSAGAQAKVSAEPQSETQLLLPDAVLQLERVRAMDAVVHFQGAKIDSGKLPLQEVSIDLKLDHGVLTIAPFAFRFPQGKLSGTARVDARKDTPDVVLDVRLTNVSLERLLQTPKDKQPAIEGTLVARADVHGRGASVHEAAATSDGTVTMVIPHGEIRSAFAELTGINVAEGIGLLITKSDEQSEVRCGVADFQAQQGVLQVRNLVFDTSKVLITGGGKVDLRSEELDLAIKGQPKKIRLVRLRSPIKIGGHLKKPKIGIEGGKAVAQAGVAAAVGAVLAPLAAVIAFVDPGLAKDANCSALLEEAKEKGVPENLAPARHSTH